MERNSNKDVDEAILQKAHSLLPYVKLANACDVTVTDIRDVPKLLVALYESLTSEEIKDKQKHDGGRGQAIILQTILDTLENTLRHVSLSHLSGPGLVRLDRRQLSEALEIFDDLLKHMFQPEVSHAEAVLIYDDDGEVTPVGGRLTLSQLESPGFRIDITPTFSPKLSILPPSSKDAVNLPKPTNSLRKAAKMESTELKTKIERKQINSAHENARRPSTSAYQAERFTPYRKPSVSHNLPPRRLSARGSKPTYTISKCGSSRVKNFKSPPPQNGRQRSTSSVRSTKTSVSESHVKLVKVSKSQSTREPSKSVRRGGNNFSGRALQTKNKKGTSALQRDSVSSNKDVVFTENVRQMRPPVRSLNAYRQSIVSFSEDHKFSRSEESRQPVRHKKDQKPEFDHVTEQHQRPRRPSVRSTKVIRHSITSVSGSPKQQKTTHLRSTQHGKDVKDVTLSPRTSSLTSSITFLKEFHNIEKRMKDIIKERREIEKKLLQLRDRDDRLAEEEVRLEYVVNYLRDVLKIPLQHLPKSVSLK